MSTEHKETIKINYTANEEYLLLCLQEIDESARHIKADLNLLNSKPGMLTPRRLARIEGHLRTLHNDIEKALTRANRALAISEIAEGRISE